MEISISTLEIIIILVFILSIKLILIYIQTKLLSKEFIIKANELEKSIRRYTKDKEKQDYLG